MCLLYSDIRSMQVCVTGSKLIVNAALSITLLYRGVYFFLLRSGLRFLNLVLHKTCFSQALEYLYGVAKIKSQNLRVTIPIRWLKPPMNWLKLNTDRDSAGRWVKGFSRSIGLATNVMAKCWALRDGMQLANHLGIQNIVVELDAKIIVDILQSNQETNNSFSPLLMDCRLLLRNFPQSRVSHVYRKRTFVLMLWQKGVCHKLRILLYLIILHLMM